MCYILDWKGGDCFSFQCYDELPSDVDPFPRRVSFPLFFISIFGGIRIGWFRPAVNCLGDTPATNGVYGCLAPHFPLEVLLFSVTSARGVN
jgi:hypothetical protein